jgi:hypothetical protein
MRQRVGDRKASQDGGHGGSFASGHAVYVPQCKLRPARAAGCSLRTPVESRTCWRPRPWPRHPTSSAHVPFAAPGLVLRGFTPPLRLADFKLIAFDMDSTLINIECVDEIAAAAGRKAEVAAITEAAMRGEISDYKDSLRRASRC